MRCDDDDDEHCCADDDDGARNDDPRDRDNARRRNMSDKSIGAMQIAAAAISAMLLRRVQRWINMFDLIVRSLLSVQYNKFLVDVSWCVSGRQCACADSW